MLDFLTQHSTLLVGIGSALGGALVSLLVGWLLRKRDYNLRLWEKLVDRRINAHEELIGVAMEMRIMVGSGSVAEDGELVRAPQVLISKTEFEGWFTRAIRAGVGRSTWLATDAKREVNFLQDYLATLYVHLKGVPDHLYFSLGALVRQDFVDISSRLERAAFAFFKSRAHRLEIGNLEEWHKHPRDQTQRLLQATQLLRRHEEWQRLVNESAGS